MRICLTLLCLCCCAAVAHAEPEAAPAEKTAQQLADELKPSVVVITMQGRDGQQQGLGTGFVISADGLIATNLHVIGEARPIRVQTADGKELPVSAVHASDRALDLAIVKVEADNLSALPLADSSAAKAGQSVVAIGNPHGLKHSIVHGVISGTREIDSRKMLQLAIPVEPGNSGGPVVDMAGRVVGIMTLKAQLTENLGFAIESNALKPLLEKPNTVPMSRWLKIGTLDANRWTPLFGANWNERGGRTAVSGGGGAFGGRSLCLANETPRVPYEVAVRVRFADRSGAAGLVFHADGGDKHYGFYPSAGKLRLSRFDGPSVFQWQVLSEVDSEHYREGEWNDLKVRVEPGKLICSINGHVVIESTDAELTAGKVGLAKFRDTSAEFRRFRVGEKLPDDPVETTVSAELEKAIAALPPLAELTAAELESIARGGETARRVLEQRANDLERRAGELRRIAADVRTHAIVTTLTQTINKPDERGQFDLLRAALLLASLDDEELEYDAYESQCARMVEEIQKSLAAEATEADKLAALDKYLFTEQGYHGSRTEYYHAANSHLHRVIDDREGLPITLSVLYLELGRRLGLKI
jgi:serine protease Do